MTLLLSTDDCARLLKMPECISVLEQAYQALAEREATYRPRSDLVVPTVPDEDYWLATMEGAIRPFGVAAIRLRSDYKRTEIKYGIPRIQKWAKQPGLYCGLVILYSLETAEPLAIITDGYLQVMRVAATSALGGKYLARPESRVLGIIGGSWQARDHARAYASLFRLEKIKVFCRTPETRERFAEQMSEELGVPIEAMSSAREVVEGSDIVATCTDSQVPVLDGDWLEPGVYLSSIRYFGEIKPQNARTIDLHVAHPPEYGPTLRAGRPEEWGRSPSANPFYDVSIPEGAVALHDIIGGHAPGRTSAQQRILLNNHSGMGIQFAAVGKVVYERGREQGVGREIPTDWLLQDIST